MRTDAIPHGYRTSRLRTLLSWAGVIVAALAISALFKAFIGAAYAIPSGSMEGTLQIGDRIWAERLSYALGDEPVAGDIVTFIDQRDPSRTLIKRVIATEGQTVDLQDGRVLVDDQVLDEPYTDGKPTLPLKPVAGPSIAYPCTVPAGTVWVMGDNRTDSLDPRAFGPIPEDAITGKAFMRTWPIDRFGALG